MMTQITDVASGPRVRRAIRIHEVTDVQSQYWASKRGYTSVNEYMAEAVEEKIRRENQDYDLPTLEQQRLNQLIDENQALSRTMANLERVMVNGFESLLGLTRGDNYLIDKAEDGELDNA